MEKDDMKECSQERGCRWKANLGSNVATAAQYAEKLKTKHGKDYGVYKCPHCEGHHLTTKLQNADKYKELVYTTNGEGR